MESNDRGEGGVESSAEAGSSRAAMEATRERGWRRRERDGGLQHGMGASRGVLEAPRAGMEGSRAVGEWDEGMESSCDGRMG